MKISPSIPLTAGISGVIFTGFGPRRFVCVYVVIATQRLISLCFPSCRTPAMIGCSFVADREYFGELGLLDSGMDVYGGENIELGIRVCVSPSLLS